MKKEIPEFGIKRENEERRDGGCGIVFDPKTKKYAVAKHDTQSLLRLFSGGVEVNEDIQEGVLREVTEESGLYDFDHIEKVAEAEVHYYHSLKHLNRIGHSTCFLVILKSSNLKPAKLEEHEKFTLAWATAEEIFANWHNDIQSHDVDHWIYFLKKAVTRLKELGY